jgi:hypothetical protein
MNRDQLIIGFGVCMFGAMAVTFVTKAGDLNPPVGAIQSTMTNLQDIQTSLDNIGAAVNVPTPAWDVIAANAGPVETTPVVGSGVIHAIIFHGGGECMLRPDGTTVGIFQAPGGTSTKYVLDIRYETGISIKDYESVGADLTFLYRADPTP